MTLTPRLDAARARARAAEVRSVALRVEVVLLRRDRDTYARRLAEEQDVIRILQDRLARNDSVAAAALRREVAMLRETVAALDARNDSLRREVAHWEAGHAACERARQLIERAQPTGWGSTS